MKNLVACCGVETPERFGLPGVHQSCSRWGKRHQSMSSCSQGLLRGFLSVKPWPRVQSKSWKRRGKSPKVFSIYTPQARGAPWHKLLPGWVSLLLPAFVSAEPSKLAADVTREPTRFPPGKCHRRENIYFSSKPSPSPWLAYVRNALCSLL